MCPVCGWYDETKLHMYQCPHSDAKRTRERATLQMKEYLTQHGIPTHIGRTFIDMCKAICSDIPIKPRYPVIQSIETTIKYQQLLPREFILRGYLTTHWLHALLDHDRNSAETSMTRLLLSLWNILFAQIWEFCNGTLHGGESIVETYERRNLLQELREWKRDSATKLGATQLYLTSYSISDASKWQTGFMKTTTEILAKAAKNYRTSLLERHPLITQYFTAADMPPDWIR